MKFFWKIFFTTMFVSVICFALGGYILINSNFNALLNNEVQTSYDYGEIVYYSLVNEFKDTEVTSSYPYENDEKEIIEKTVAKLSQSISINNMNQKISFSVVSIDKKPIFTSLVEDFDKDIISLLSENQAGWSLKKAKNSIYVQTLRPAIFQGNTFYIETIRDATFIFNNQKSQYETLLKIMIGMLIPAGLITFIVSKLLMRRVVALTRVTENISAGNLSNRADTKGDDEFSSLSKNFNQMADNLEEKINELKDVAEKKELFVGAFSHEIKTPLTSVIGYSDMLRRKEMSNEQIHTCAEYIFSEGKRLETLSMRLLDLIVLKNQEIKLTCFDIKNLIDEVCFIIVPQLKRLGINFSCDIERATIALEPELMKTVFINIIDNAKKAVEENGEISLRGVRHQDFYIITVQDNGKGMEKQELSKIKEAFYMVDKSRSKKQGGTGLGLAICDEILKLHGFKISFESVLNVGTIATITMKEAKNVQIKEEL